MEGDKALNDQLEEVAAFLNDFQTDDEPSSAFDVWIQDVSEMTPVMKKHTHHNAVEYLCLEFLVRCLNPTNFQYLELQIIFCWIPAH